MLRRRGDGYHDIESLVAFADCGDRLALTPGEDLTLKVTGPSAAASGAEADNLVIKAARALAERVPGLRLGTFALEKNLPVAAGLGGGSADAAAGLRLLARSNDLAPDDSRLYDAARATGADVPVCLDPRPRVMRGVGEVLSAPLPLPQLPAVLVNPGVALATKLVFSGCTPAADSGPVDAADFGSLADIRDQRQLLDWLAHAGNDLEAPAIALAPAIADVLTSLRAAAGCRLARMSGSGATCFGLFASPAESAAAVKKLRAQSPAWWISETMLG